MNIKNLFRTPTGLDLAKDQIEDARRQYTLHTAAAEHHQALADMYLKRIERLTVLTSKEKTE